MLNGHFASVAEGELLVLPRCYEFDEPLLLGQREKEPCAFSRITLGSSSNDFEFKRVGGGLLVQTP